MKVLLKNIFLLTILIISIELSADDEDFFLKEHLKTVRKNPKVLHAKEKIIYKNNILYCTGNSKVAILNNRVASLMEKGKYRDAAQLLEKKLVNASLFFPFRFNLGVCYIHLSRYKRAILHLKKASYIVPQYSKPYLQIGYAYDRLNRTAEAIEYYRIALKKNPNELETFVLMGDIHFRRNQVELADKYYKAALKVNHRYPNGLLGIAKVFYYKKKYVKAIVLFKTIDTTKEYDKSLHYYFAESSYKLNDYETAYSQYKKLLTFKNDKFFITNSPSLIQHKLGLSKKFTQK